MEKGFTSFAIEFIELIRNELLCLEPNIKRYVFQTH